MTSRVKRGVALELFLALISILLIPVVKVRGLSDLPLTSVMNLGMDFAGLAFVLVLNATTISNRVSTRGSRGFGYLVLVEFSALYTDVFAWIVDGVPGLRWANILDNTIFYMCSVGIGIAYLFFVMEFLHLQGKGIRGFFRIAMVGFALITMLLVLNIWTGWIFSVSPENVYSRSFLYPVTFVMPLAILIAVPFFIMKVDDLKLAQRGALVGFCVAPIVSAGIQTFTYGVSFMYILTLIALVFVYVLIYLKEGEDLRETRTVLSRKEEHLDERKQLILLSQIRPKYILSALSTISSLSLTNGEEAYELTNAFSEYLRHNLDSMSGVSVDTFSNELKNIDRFARVEEKRLGDRVAIVYDVGPVDFNVPVLTVQILVEKAVEKGLEDNCEDIFVWVNSKESESEYLVTVASNAAGMTLEELEETEEIHSVRSRLASFLGGSLSFSLNEGFGYSVTMSIPKKTEEA